MVDTFSAETCDRVLATDLDGTLIPLDGNEENQSDLRILARELQDNAITLLFVTGRHFASVSKAIEELQLPAPDWIICDVGTSIFTRSKSGEFRSMDAYSEHLQEIVSAMPIGALRECLDPIKGIQLQEREKQGRFKLSFYADAPELDRLLDDIQDQLRINNAPYSVIHSVDPFNGDGLIDLLPAQVSKAYALEWWCAHSRLNPDAVVFAGDSGNDLAALTAGYRAIVVANADHGVVQRAYDKHREAGWTNRLFIARGKATSGVLEGCRWFELVGQRTRRVFGLGATPVTHNQTHFRVWAPNQKEVRVGIIDGQSNVRHHSLIRDEHGYFQGDVSGASPHAGYHYLLDGGISRPDPASRYQPDGVHGASKIVLPDAFPWTDRGWKGISKRDLIIYELHIGAFTEKGTFRAATERIPELVDLGVTAVEIMPVAQSPGRWGWGYDGVDLFAVRDTYGEPDDFKAFADACHRSGLAVILDVVYDRVGPEGNYLDDFGPYFSQQTGTACGEGFNLDGPHAKHVRQFVLENAIRWLDEYHLDGLRLDAVHSMHDDGKPSLPAEIRAAVSKYSVTTDRVIHLIVDANVCGPELLESEGDEAPFDATWHDSLMHSIHAHACPDLSHSYRGAENRAEALQHGCLYCWGDHRPVRVGTEQRRNLSRGAGQPQIASFVTALQTHDGVGNHPHGQRLHHLTSKAFQKAAAALTVLYPSIPLIFMGEECASNALFPFFADFEDPKLREVVEAERANEYPRQVWGKAGSPFDPQTFLSAKCPRDNAWDEDMLAWYRNLIMLRKQGLAEGWLCSSRLTAEHNSDLGLFSLAFANDDDAEITIQVRLAGVNRQSTIPAHVTGDIMLSSEPVLRDEVGRILLRPHQAVICLARRTIPEGGKPTTL